MRFSRFRTAGWITLLLVGNPGIPEVRFPLAISDSYYSPNVQPKIFSYSAGHLILSQDRSVHVVIGLLSIFCRVSEIQSIQ